VESLKDLYFNEKGFIFDPDSGAIYSLNPTGAFILKHLQQGTSISQILKETQKAFGVDASTAQQDLREFMDMLTSLGLLVTTS
jgi:PqqD family protein of HPr-rel-A system